MKLKLHHINLSTERVAEMDEFYRDIMCLDVADDDLPTLKNDEEVYSGHVAFISDGDMHLHLAKKDVMAGFRTRQLVNPVEKGHIAYRCDDITAFKAHLDAKGVPYSDWGNSAVAGWHQIYFYDPDGNVIEVHEVTG